MVERGLGGEVSRVKARVARVIGIVIAAILILTTIIALLIFIPQWQAAHIANDAVRLEREDSTRRTLAQIMGGTVGLVIIYITWQRLQVAREELRVAQEGQVTERFSRAIDHLGNDSLDVRLGAIYALERIARDSRQDHGPIMEILTAYVREHAPWKPPRKDQQQETDQQHSETPSDMAEDYSSTFDLGIEGDDASPLDPATDIQAVLTILGRRQAHYDPLEEVLNLRNTNLCRANLIGANLQKAFLVEASLQEAGLQRANLQRAILVDANLQDAQLDDANLEGAVLISANLYGAILTGANLQEANLIGADLRGTDLSEAKGLTSQQLEFTLVDEDAQLPPGVERPDLMSAQREDAE